MKQDNNTQSKVEGEKPDFEKMANEWVVSQPPHGNIGLNAFPANLGFKAGAWRIWTDYVAPLYSRIKELEAENEELRKSLHGFTDAYLSADELVESLKNFPDSNAPAWDGIRQIIKAKRLLEQQPLPSKPENK